MFWVKNEENRFLIRTLFWRPELTLLKAPSNFNNGNLDQFVPLDMCYLSLSSMFAGTCLLS